VEFGFWWTRNLWFYIWFFILRNKLQ